MVDVFDTIISEAKGNEPVTLAMVVGWDAKVSGFSDEQCVAVRMSFEEIDSASFLACLDLLVVGSAMIRSCSFRWLRFKGIHYRPPAGQDIMCTPSCMRF